MENYNDKVVVEARTKLKPGVVDQKRNEILDASEFYAGCYARATLTCYAYDSMGNKGVSFGLQNVQKVKDGTAFSGKRNAKDDFDEIEDLDSDADLDKDFENSDDDSTDENDF